ncbi:hypothetical protein MASR2M15_11330 [Anaerolineales bacterium]
MSNADEIKNRIDIVEYIRQYVPLKKAGRTFKACCPFHNEKTPSFVVNPDKQSWRCFGACAEGGDVYNFAMRYHGWTFPEAIRELGRQVGIEVEKQSPQQRADSEHKDYLRGIMASATAYYVDQLWADNPQSKSILAYSREKRGFTDDTLNQFEIGYAPDHWTGLFDEMRLLGYASEDLIDVGLIIRNESGRLYDRFRNRLMIPIRDRRGRVIAFGARTLDPDGIPKYLNSPQTPLFDKSQTLFALDAAHSAIRHEETAVIVEGYMDAIQAHQAGYKNVVAQMGTAMTEAQLKQLVPRLAQKVILALDADEAGQSATRRSLEVARNVLAEDFTGRLSADIRILQIPGAKDPDDFLREHPEEWPQLIERAQALANFVIDMETTGLDINRASTIERKNLAISILPLLMVSEDNFYRQHNLQQLALRLHIPEHDLLAWASELRRIEQARPPKQEAPKQEMPGPPKAAPRDMPEAGFYEDFAYDDYPYDDESVGTPEPPLWLDSDSSRPQEPEQSASILPSIQFPKTPKPFQELNSSRREEFCLRLILLKPDIVYRISRRMRELAGEDELLLNRAFLDLGPDDFEKTDHKAIMSLIMDSLKQYKQEPLAYIKMSLPSNLSQVFDQLLLNEDLVIKMTTSQKLPAETASIWKHITKTHLFEGVTEQDFMWRVLELRIARIERQIAELRFLHMDAKDSEGMNFDQETNILLYAKDRIRRAIVEGAGLA